MNRLFTIVFLLFSALSHGQSFAGLYTFANVTNSTGLTDPTPPPTATGVVFGSFSATGTPANPNANGRFSFVNWPTGATNGNDNFSSLTGNINAGEYYEVTIGPASGYSIDLSSIGFTVQRSAFGIRTWVVRSSQDGFSTNLAASINPANNNLSVQGADTFFWNFDAQTNAQNGSFVSLGGPSFTALTAPVIFRFYAMNSESGTGTFSIDNVTFTGNATALLIAADFSPSSNAVCDGTQVQFTDNSVSYNGPITNWSWNFGDPASGPNNTSTLQNPSHTFSTCGTYTVTLIVTNSNNNSDTTTSIIDVYCNPQVGFTAAPTSGCTPCVDFTDTTMGNPAIWNWDFGDLGTATAQNPQHCYSSPGVYSVTLSVLDLNGCSGSATLNNYITVYPALVADYTFSPTGLSVNFSDISSGGTGPYTYTFDPGDGSPPLPFLPGTYTYPYDNIWTACLTITDVNGCTDSVCYVINIVTTGAGGPTEEQLFSVFPNPSADGLFHISAVAKTKIVVTDILGNVVLNASEGSTVIDLVSQPAGTYFVKFVSGNEVYVRKITKE